MMPLPASSHSCATHASALELDPPLQKAQPTCREACLGLPAAFAGSRVAYGTCAQVPDGYRMHVTASPQGGIRRLLEPLVSRRPTWEWSYGMGPRGDILLREAATLTVFQPAFRQEAVEPFSYII